MSAQENPNDLKSAYESLEEYCEKLQATSDKQVLFLGQESSGDLYEETS
jgi:hypothetical protein